MPERTCSVDECGQPSYAKGMCKPHYRRDYYRKNGARERANFGVWRERNIDHEKARWADYYAENRDDLAGKRLAHYDANRDDILAKAAERRAADPDADRRWREQNPERWAERNRANQHRRNHGGLITAEQVIAWYGTTCHICGEAIDPAEVTVDHLIPLGLDGPNVKWNVRPAHGPCNLRKGIRLLIDGEFVRATEEAIAEVTRRFKTAA